MPSPLRDRAARCGPIMRYFIFLIWLLAACVLLLGFGGRFHGAGDTLALARPLVVPVLGLISLGWVFGRHRALGLVGLCLAGIAMASIVPPTQTANAQGGQGVYSVYQKNLLFRLPKTAPVAADILSTEADFVTLQELHKRNRPILTELRARYPYQHFCPFAAVGGIAVLSQWPPIAGKTLCEEFGGLAAMQVETPDGPLWVVSVHLHWPYPYRQFEQVAELRPMLERLEGPTVVGGDFNMVSWSHAVQSVARATGTVYSGYPGGSFAFSYHLDGRNMVGWLPRLPIDHVLLPDGAERVSVQLRPRLGSDHHGVIATFRR